MLSNPIIYKIIYEDMEFFYQSSTRVTQVSAVIFYILQTMKRRKK